MLIKKGQIETNICILIKRNIVTKDTFNNIYKNNIEKTLLCYVMFNRPLSICCNMRVISILVAPGQTRMKVHEKAAYFLTKKRVIS